ncbi:MAG: carboxypeptidase regulatory-like domain-containing protein, partial [Deltaproteobacteria bacterium]|nr:carboxypeptidase regulatory-like domain-containing protein [Deltaproteobacteria bacterium]
MLGKATTATALSICLSILGPTVSVSAATLEGVVTTSAGQPVNGAMVTVFSADRMRKQTVFTDPEGRYLVVVDYEGQLTVRARASSFVDQTQTVSIDEAE